MVQWGDGVKLPKPELQGPPPAQPPPTAPSVLIPEKYSSPYSRVCIIFLSGVSFRPCTTWSFPWPDELTVVYNLPLLFMATKRALFTPKRLTTPRSTVEISSRPDEAIRAVLPEACADQTELSI